MPPVKQDCAPAAPQPRPPHPFPIHVSKPGGGASRERGSLELKMPPKSGKQGIFAVSAIFPASDPDKSPIFQLLSLRIPVRKNRELCQLNREALLRFREIYLEKQEFFLVQSGASSPDICASLVQDESNSATMGAWGEPGSCRTRVKLTSSSAKVSLCASIPRK